MGQQLPRRSLAVAAALPLITDTKTDGRRGRNGPRATKCAAAKCRLFNHLVCESEEILRQGDAGCLRGLEVDDELVACRLLEREIGGPRAVKDASCKFRSAGHAFLHVRPI